MSSAATTPSSVAQHVRYTIDFGTGAQIQVPPQWSRDYGGRQAATFAAVLKAGNPLKQNLRELRPYWTAFRLMGTVDLHFEFSSGSQADAFVSSLRAHPASVKPLREDCPWGKHGDPAEGGSRNNVSIHKVLDALRSYNAISINEPGLNESDETREVEPANEWQMRWLALVQQMNQPGGQWDSPFMLPITPPDKIQQNGPIVTIHTRLYVGRLLFYLIADEALADIMRPLTPVGPVDETFSVAERSFPETFTRGVTTASPFSVQGIMRAAEHVGYAEAAQPREIALTMKPYQLQTLQWMIDQEQLPRGLNGCFWETRAWFLHNDNNEDDSSEAEFYVSTDLGEFRLEKPPLVRGGLLCEEMGLGKSLEIVALITATRKQAATSPVVRPKGSGLQEINATLIVVPDPLIAQWKQEISKSCLVSEQLKVVTFAESQTLKGDDFLQCDVCLTTFRTVERDRTLQRFMWRRVVIDEMQMIRSSTTKVAKMCENLSAHARWMVSGTPLYTSVKDLNGLLNFLQVIPFSLLDTKDGFWSQRLGKPLEAFDPDALDLLLYMLGCLMMRHSKAQRSKSGSLAGRSILELPEMHKEIVGVSFGSYEEEAAYRHVEAAYRHVEAIGLRAAQAQLTSQTRQRQDRPAVVAVDILRSVAISPNLLTGGLGVTGDMAKLARLWRALVPAHEGGGGYHTAVGGMPSTVQNELFANPVALPGSEIRDLLLSKTASAGGTRGVSQNDVAMGLEKAQQEVQQRRDTLSFQKAKSFEGLPFRRWKWALKCILAGQYHLVQMCRCKFKFASMASGSEFSRLARTCPILFRRAFMSFGSLRQFSLAQLALDKQIKFFMDMEPVKLIRALKLSYEPAKVIQVEVSEGVFEDQLQLWFKTGNHALLPSKPPSLYEAAVTNMSQTRNMKRRHKDDEEDDDVEGSPEDEDDDDESFVDEDQNEGERLNLSELARMRVRNRVERAQQKEADRFDFYAHESFWRKAFCKALMKRYESLRREAEARKLAWTTTSHNPPETFSVRQMIHCASLHPGSLRFEAVYWYNSAAHEAAGRVNRAWFPLKRIPEPLEDGRGARVTFLDGEQRIVDHTEIRLTVMDFAAAARPEANDSMTIPATAPSSPLTTTEPSTTAKTRQGLTLSDALDHLKLSHLRANFADMIGKDDDLSLALALPEEDLNKRMLNEKDLAVLTKEHSKESVKQQIRLRASARVEKFRQANLLRDARQIKIDLEDKAEDALRALSSQKKAILSLADVTFSLQPLCSSIISNAAWGYLWRLDEGKHAEPIPWISVTFGLKGTGTRQTELAPKARVPRILSTIKTSDRVLVRLAQADSNPHGSLGVGWFQATCVHVPDQNDIITAPTWTVRVRGKEAELSRVSASNIRREPLSERKGSKKKRKVGLHPTETEDILPEDNEKRVNPEGKKKKRQRMSKDSDNEETNEPSEAEEADEVEEDEDVEEEEDAEVAKLGYREFGNGLVRVRFSVNIFQSIASAKERVNLLLRDIEAAKAALPDLERYESLLVLACERGGIAGVQLASQQGFQALEELIERDPLALEAPKGATQCPICWNPLFHEPVILGCLHLFCKDCLLTQKKAHDASAQSYKPLACSLCRRDINPAEMFLVLPTVKDQPMPVPSSPPVDANSAGHKGTGPEWNPALDDEAVKKDFSHLPDGVPNWDAYSGRFLGLPRTLQTLLRLAAGVPVLGCSSSIVPSRLSSKIVQVLNDIRAIEGKVVVCSQFSKAVSVLMAVFRREGITAVKVARGDTLDELSEAINTFTTKPECKVLVLHAGSGAAGLTLTVASHVLLLEPFFRAGEEAQALNRVHRIGQTNAVTTKCYYMRGTIEERVLAWRNLASGEGSSRLDREQAIEEEENGLIVLAGDDQAKSVASLSNEFLAHVLGASQTVPHSQS